MTGFGGTGIQKVTEDQAITIKPASGAKILTVNFQSSVPDTMPWSFTPTQNNVKVYDYVYRLRCCMVLIG